LACGCQRTPVQDEARSWHVSEVLAANERLSDVRAKADHG
jgi:hypothetical protein